MPVLFLRIRRAGDANRGINSTALHRLLWIDFRQSANVRATHAFPGRATGAGYRHESPLRAQRAERALIALRSHRRLDAVLLDDGAGGSKRAVGLLRGADEDRRARLQQAHLVRRECHHRRLRADDDVLLAVLVLQLERGLAALRYFLDLGHGGVGHAVVLAFEVPGVVAFAGAARRLGEEQHFLGVQLAVLAGRRRDADEIVLLDVGEADLLDGEHAELVAHGDRDGLAVLRLDGEGVALDLLDLAADVDERARRHLRYGGQGEERHQRSDGE